MTDNLKAILIRMSYSLEFLISSPAKSHVFTSLPLQSSNLKQYSIFLNLKSKRMFSHTSVLSADNQDRNNENQNENNNENQNENNIEDLTKSETWVLEKQLEEHLGMRKSFIVDEPFDFEKDAVEVAKHTKKIKAIKEELKNRENLVDSPSDRFSDTSDGLDQWNRKEELLEKAVTDGLLTEEEAKSRTGYKPKESPSASSNDEELSSSNSVSKDIESQSPKEGENKRKIEEQADSSEEESKKKRTKVNDDNDDNGKGGGSSSGGNGSGGIGMLIPGETSTKEGESFNTEPNSSNKVIFHDFFIRIFLFFSVTMEIVFETFQNL